jgi:integrase/recombinase XerD
LDFADLDAALVTVLLTCLETERGNSVITRNARLTAIRSPFPYAASRHPEHAGLIMRVLAIPSKRHEQTMVCFLTPDEVDALLAPDRTTWHGRRDHALLTLTVQTGLRVSELTNLTISDMHLGTGACVHCVGKGRKHRVTPLTSLTVAVSKVWLRAPAGNPTDPLFPSRRGRPLSTDAVAWLLNKHVTTAIQHCPTLAGKNVTPHVLRHPAAMRLLQPASTPC